MATVLLWGFIMVGGGHSPTLNFWTYGYERGVPPNGVGYKGVHTRNYFVTFSVQVGGYQTTFTTQHQIVPTKFRPAASDLRNYYSVRLDCRAVSVFKYGDAGFQDVCGFVSYFLILSTSSNQHFVPSQTSTRTPLDLMGADQAIYPTYFRSDTKHLFSKPTTKSNINIEQVYSNYSQAFSIVYSNVYPSAFSIHTT